MRTRVSIGVALWLTLVLLSAAPAQKTLNVPAEYKTIQAAIDAAQTSDTVLVASGTYREPIDFKGKAIQVVCGGLPYSAVLDGQLQQVPVVTFATNELRQATLAGFTITQSGASGILIKGSSPTIQGCRIVGNRNSAYDEGGGIRCDSGQPLIVDCLITNNGVARFGGLGGGVFSRGSAEIVNTVIADNSATDGGGVQGFAHLVNCVVVRNFAEETGGGIDGSCTLRNAIVWANSAKLYPQIFSASAEHCCVQGGYSGRGNIDQNPCFVSSTDYHLRAMSPCINAGLNSAPSLPAIDFEGDPRIAEGTVDIGADEFFPHLYHVGTATPTGTIDVNFVGKPGAYAWWGFSHDVLTVPASIPGLSGWLYLNPAGMAVLPVGQVPLGGTITIRYTFAASFPKISIPMQALIGFQLSNLDPVHVQ
ncbi:MAG: hypothetical protein JXQ29_16800 [Planctomycetes bacterium]|nr:hypothetical protein [Planctomycetota bacterium]